MDKISNIKKTSSEIEDKIEKKLYCIKSYEYKYDEIFKDSFGFQFKIRPFNKDDEIKLVIIDNICYSIDNEARLITFIFDGIEKVRFIYSGDYLEKVFGDYNIQHYSTNNDNFAQINDSIESEISIKEIFELFQNKDITKIYQIENNYKEIINLFNHRYFMEGNRIADLSLNAKYYYPENANDKLDSVVFKDYIKKFNTLIRNGSINIIYFLGPKGVSKSLFLMNFCFFHNIKENPTLYINYKKLKKLEKYELKKIFKKEMIYLFFNEDKFKDFYKLKFHRIIKEEENDLIHNLTKFIEKSIEIYENTFEKKITLVLDNFNETNEKIYDEMKKLIDLINSHPTKIRLIISGNNIFIKNKFKLFLIKQNFDDIIDHQALFLYNPKLKDNNEILSLAAFNYRKNKNDKNFEEILLNEEKEYCKKLNVYGMNYSLINMDKKLNLNSNSKDFLNFSDYIKVLPFEYLIFSINEDKSFTFNYFNPIFLNAVKLTLKPELKEKSLNYLLSEDNKDVLVNAIYEEKLLSTLISYNKLDLKNMNTSDNNLLEVNKIFELKEKTIKKTNNIINQTEPIIITQENYRGENYDLLVLIPNKEEKDINEIKNENKNKKYYYTAYLIQIGTNKPKNKIDSIKSEFNDNRKNYILVIKKFIDNSIDIKEIHLVFIFDKENQEKLLEKKTSINDFGSKYCIQNKINFYCFSLKDHKLYKTFDISDFYEITDFGDFSKNTKRNWDQYTKSIYFYFLTEKDIEFIKSKSSSNIFDMPILNQKNKMIKDLKGTIKKNDIYILMNNINKYFIINEIYYNCINDDYTEISPVEIDKNEKFSLFILLQPYELKVRK